MAGDNISIARNAGGYPVAAWHVSEFLHSANRRPQERSPGRRADNLGSVLRNREGLGRGTGDGIERPEVLEGPGLPPERPSLEYATRRDERPAGRIVW